MHKSYRHLVTVLCLLLFTPVKAQSLADSLRIFDREHPLVYEDAWDLWPYSFLNAEGEAVGYNIDLVKLILDELDIPYIIKLKPTKKALEDIRRSSPTACCVARPTHCALKPRQTWKITTSSSMRAASLIII